MGSRRGDGCSACGSPVETGQSKSQVSDSETTHESWLVEHRGEETRCIAKNVLVDLHDLLSFVEGDSYLFWLNVGKAADSTLER